MNGGEFQKFIQPFPFCLITILGSRSVGQSIDSTIVEPSNENVDATALKCWIVGLDPVAYQSILTEKKISPVIRISDLSYPVYVKNIATEMALYVRVEKADAEETSQRLVQFIAEYNVSSENNSRSNGIVHNASVSFSDDGFQLHLDLGSAGVLFLRKALKKLDTSGKVKAVLLDY
ncbi:MAG: hypothetical protein EOO08_11930 [Chitinophagaceae bacterium]|nr:MAG: hypothetical protein EOO08_11930 [Chitinophagaceae bacterium]